MKFVATVTELNKQTAQDRINKKIKLEETKTDKDIHYN
jgi:hypothetical protein